MSFWKQWANALSPRINASEFEQKLLDVEESIQNCTSENCSRCQESLSNLNKLLNQRVKTQDRARFIQRMVDLQTKLAAYQTSFAESSSSKNFRGNVATRKTPQNSRSNSRQQDYQRSSTKPTEFYNKSASYSSTVLDLENAVSKNTEDYNQNTNAAKKLPINKQKKFSTLSKHELNDNAENRAYNLRIKTYNSAVRTDNQQQRFPETHQNRPTEQEMRQIMNNTYQSFSNRMDENQISSSSKTHQNGNKSTTKNSTSQMENNREQLEKNRYGFREDRKDEYQRKLEEQQHCNRYEGNNQSQTFTGGIFEQQRNRNHDVRAGEETVHTVLPGHHYNLPSIHGLSQNTDQMIDKVSHEYPVRVAQRSGDHHEEEALQQQQQQYNSRWEGYSFTGPKDTRGHTHNEFNLLLNCDQIKAATVGKEAAYNSVKENCYNLADENMRREAQQFEHQKRHREEEWRQYQRNNQGNVMVHSQTESYGHYEPTYTKYETNYKNNVAIPRTETVYKDFEDNQSNDNWSVNNPMRVTQTFWPYQNQYQTYVRHNTTTQQFGHHHEEHQRQREEEEEEEEALQQAQQRHQREIEEKRQRQEREKVLQHQRQLEEQRIKEKERQQQQQAEEINKTEIVDISDKFIDDSIKNHPNKNNLEYFKLIQNKAKFFEHSIEQFKGDDYMEYFILHENLMQLIEIMDRIRCEKDETLFPNKIKIIEYIKRLIEDLDARNQS